MDELRETPWDRLLREAERRFSELSTTRTASQLPPEAKVSETPCVQSGAALSDLDRLSPLPHLHRLPRISALTRLRIGTMKHTKAEFDAAKAAAAEAGPCGVEEIQSWEDWKSPVYFTCASGVLLWGQLHSTMEGYMAKEVDTALGPYQTLKPGGENYHGTILQHCFRYRAPARKGVWKVEATFGRSATRPLGYVCHHGDADGVDILRRAATVRVSLQNDHADRDIVYINRYDWGRWGCGEGYRAMAELLKPDKKVEKMPKGTKPKPRGNKKFKGKKPQGEDDWDEYKEALVMNRLMLVDAQGFPQLLQSLRNGVKLEAKNYLFRDNKKDIAESAPPSSDSFGVNLGVGDHEYELGWMAFQNGELVGFVYDGVYCDLDLQFFRLGDTEFEVPREPTPEFDEGDESGNDSADNPF